MKSSTSPIFAIVVGAVLVVAGLVIKGSASNTGHLLGWFFLGVGAVSIVLNTLLYLRMRR